LRQKSEKKSGGQVGHPGTSLPFSSPPDEITQLQVDRSEACQQVLLAVLACGREPRQVLDVPSPRLLVQEYQAEQKQCPACQHITIAAFPAGVQAPVQCDDSTALTQWLLRTADLERECIHSRGLGPDGSVRAILRTWWIHTVVFLRSILHAATHTLVCEGTTGVC
jgi:hypothetical protein